MVFYIQPAERADRESGTASLANLPHELILNILETADTSDILNLRITHSNLVGACNDILAKRNTILYLHPTSSSLRHAIDICAHPRFSQHIEEVVLLGRISWHDMEAVVPKIRHPACVHSITASSLKGRFAAWPLRPFSGRGAPQTTANVPFEIGYEPLLKALEGLQNLRGVSFMQKVRRPGWNQTSQDLIDLHARRCALTPQTLMQQQRYADVDVLFKLVGALGSRSISLRLDGELPFAGPTIQMLQTPRADASMTKPLDDSLDLSNILNLTRLDLVLDHARSQAAAAYEDLSLLSLESILSFDTSASNITTTESKSSTRYFPRLETLILTYQDPPIPAKCKNPHRPIRPSVQVLDFSDLLQRVRHTIRCINITNIIFTTLNPSASPPNLSNPTANHLSVHHALTARSANEGRDFPALEHFAWRVNCYSHDQKCRSPGGGVVHRDCEKFCCGVYLPGCVGEMFKELAEGMGVELQSKGDGEGGEATGWWDFGVGVMKARAEAVGNEIDQNGDG